MGPAISEQLTISCEGGCALLLIRRRRRESDVDGIDSLCLSVQVWHHAAYHELSAYNLSRHGIAYRNALVPSTSTNSHFSEDGGHWLWTPSNKLRQSTSPTTFEILIAFLVALSSPFTRLRRCGMDWYAAKSADETPGWDTNTYVSEVQSFTPRRRLDSILEELATCASCSCSTSILRGVRHRDGGRPDWLAVLLASGREEEGRCIFECLRTV